MKPWLGKVDLDKIRNADWIVTNSAGANYLFSSVNIKNNQKIILVGPLLKRRSWWSLIMRDIKFLTGEGVVMKQMISPIYYPYAFLKMIRVLRLPVLENIKKLPKENIFIIRGNKDCYFCDEEDTELARKEGLKVFEVEAGHNWNENVSKQIKEIIK